jgi:hypothetical protein
VNSSSTADCRFPARALAKPISGKVRQHRRHTRLAPKIAAHIVSTLLATNTLLRRSCRSKTSRLTMPCAITMTPAASKSGEAVSTRLAMQLGGSIAVAMLDVLIDEREQFHSTILGGNMTLADPAVRAFLQTHSVAQLSQTVYGQSAILSFADASLAIGVVSLICTPLILLLRRRDTEGPIELEIGG